MAEKQSLVLVNRQLYRLTSQNDLNWEKNLQHSDKNPSGLIVDDEVYARKLLHFVLKKAGIDCQQAESGDHALALIDAGFIPQFILLDIMMPGRSGLETLGEIRKRPALASTAVVLLTGVVHEEVIKQAAKLGAKDYIRKPFHPEELAARMSKLLAAKG